MQQTPEVELIISAKINGTQSHYTKKLGPDQ
jgi:hypothetical protein